MPDIDLEDLENGIKWVVRFTWYKQRDVKVQHDQDRPQYPSCPPHLVIRLRSMK